jgi:hypothetical protein
MIIINSPIILGNWNIIVIYDGYDPDAAPYVVEAIQSLDSEECATTLDLALLVALGEVREN